MSPMIYTGDISLNENQSNWKSSFSYSYLCFWSFTSSIFYRVSWTTYFISLSWRRGLNFYPCHFCLRSTPVTNISAFCISKRRDPFKPESFITFLYYFSSTFLSASNPSAYKSYNSKNLLHFDTIRLFIL